MVLDRNEFEVAIRFRVTLRRANNWIREGLGITSIGSVMRPLATDLAFTRVNEISPSNKLTLYFYRPASNHSILIYQRY